MAARTVFDTYELLESILTYLPSKDIRIVRGVAKAWHDIVTGSVEVRKARCLGFYTDESNSNLESHPTSILLVYQIYSQDHVQFSICGPMTMNPLLRPGPQWKGYPLLPTITDDEIDTLDQQYISEPPIPVAYIVVATTEDPPAVYQNITCSIRCLTGVTVGDAVRAERQVLQHLPPECRHTSYIKIGQGRDVLLTQFPTTNG